MANSGESRLLADLNGGHVGQDKNASLFSYIEKGLLNNPNGVATIVMHQDARHLSELFTGDQDLSPQYTTECLQWTYAQLHGAALKLAAGLVANGVRPGMHIVMLLPNRVEYPLTLWTHILLRLTFIPLDPGAVTPARREELTKLIEAVDPDIVMVLDGKGAQAIEDVFAQRPSPPKVKVLLEGRVDGWKSIPDLAADGVKASVDTAQLVQDARSGDDFDRLDMILFTSGTSTGAPKGCPRHVGSANHALARNIWGDGVRCGSRILTSSANFRIISPSLNTAIWQVGATAVMLDPLSGAKGTIAAIREHRVSYIVFIPALMHAVISDPEFNDLDVSSVKYIRLGGDMITRDIFSRGRKAFPHAEGAVAHGMTEGGGHFKWPYSADTPIDDIPLFGEIPPLGHIALGSRVRVIDPETKRTLSRNEAGEVCVFSNSVIKHYLNNINQDSFFHDDGTNWFRTGDLGMINDEGLIYILGRIKDVIKRSGIPITPAALENCIGKFTGSQTCVLAWPHPVLGQEPLAVVESLNGKTENDVKEQVLELFGPDYALGPVFTLEQLGQDKFPLNATGKIVKMDVLKMVQEHVGQGSKI